VAVYHFTLHAYRSWRPDHPRGYTRKGIGYVSSDPDRADKYDRNAKQEPVQFDERTQREILVMHLRSTGTSGGPWKAQDSTPRTRISS
jgi:hypothetical protein